MRAAAPGDLDAALELEPPSFVVPGRPQPRWADRDQRIGLDLLEPERFRHLDGLLAELDGVVMAPCEHRGPRGLREDGRLGSRRLRVGHEIQRALEVDVRAVAVPA